MRQWMLPPLTALSAALSLGACDPGAGVRPPADQIFFPTGVAADPSGQRLYLSNGNFNALFDGGTVTVLDLASMDADGVACRAALDSGAAAPAGCQAVPGLPATLCQTSASGRCDLTQRTVPYIDAAATVEIASFPGDFTLSPDGDRLYFTVRGDQSLSLIDLDPTASGQDALFCDQVALEDGVSPRCSGDHVLLADRESAIPEFGNLVRGFEDGVFSVAIDQNRQIEGAGVSDLLYVSHLDTGFLSLFRVAPDGRLIFQRSQGLAPGVNQLAVHPQTGFLYVARRDVVVNGSNILGTRLEVIKPQLDPEDNARLAMARENTLIPPLLDSGASDFRALAFGDGGNLLYVGARNPSAVLVIDTSLGDDGLPKNELVGRVDVDLTPQQIRVVETPLGELVYVADFENASVHVIDPALLDSGTARTAIRVGQGPFGVTSATVNGAPRLIVTNFVEDTLSVIDLDPESPTFHRELYRVGAPRPAEED